MKAYEVDKVRWAFKLVPSTNRPSATSLGHTQRRNVLPTVQKLRYKPVKTLTEVAKKLTDFARRWLKNCSTVDEVKDAVVKEQLLATLPEDVRMWVKERKPKTSRGIFPSKGSRYII